MRRIPVAVLSAALVSSALWAATPFPAGISDLAWLAGHWTGTAGSGGSATSLDLSCSDASKQQIVCLFQSYDSNQLLGIEMSLFSAGSDGVTENIRYFDTRLQDADPIVANMRLATSSSTEYVFQNTVAGTSPKTIKMTRDGNDAFSVHIDTLDATGAPAAVDAKYSRAK